MLLRYHLNTIICLLALSLAGCSKPPKPEENVTQIPVSQEPVSIVHPAVSVAEQQLGIKYRPGGSSPERGFDCSGLVHYAFKQVGVSTPRTAKTLYQSAFPVDAESIQQGDLLFFKIDGKISHVGIYTGGREFIHAPSSGKVVSYDSLDTPYWRERLIGIGRLF